MIELERPTCEIVKKYIKEFDSEEKEKEDILNDIFKERFPKNNNLTEIVIKTSALNSLYSTRIRNVDIIKLAKHIKEKNIDVRLEEIKSISDAKKAIKLVERIGKTPKGPNGMKKNALSFASKYCSFHRPDVFPIYDGYTKIILRELNEKYNYYGEKVPKEIESYSKYYDIYNSFIDFFKLSEFSYKEIDKYLWKKGKDIINSEK